MMRLLVNGKAYSNWIGASATVQIDALSNSFSFSAGVGDQSGFGFERGDQCVVTIDGEQILEGYIEKIFGSGNKKSKSIQVVGRDRTADIVDSQIETLADLKPPITLKRVVEEVIKHLGADIDVVDDFGFRFSAEDDFLTPDPGMGAFQYLERLGRKAKAILTSNEFGDVVLNRAFGVEVDAAVINQRNGRRNNVLEYDFVYDDTQRFSRYVSLGNTNVNLLNLFSGQDPQKTVDRKGSAVDRFIREGRQRVIVAENPGGDASHQDRAIWEANIKKSRALTYGAIVSGFRNQSGDIWRTGTLPKVVDEEARINDYMLLNSITYRSDDVDGSTCDLGFVNKNSYQLRVDEPSSEKSDGNLDAIKARLAKAFEE